MLSYYNKLFKFKNTDKNNSKGITLVESLLAIAVGALVIAGAVAFYVNAQGNTRKNEAQTQVQAIASGIASAYQGTNNYSDLSNAVALNYKIFPSNMVSGTTVNNPWKGAVTLSGTATTYSISYASVPQDACASLVSTNAVGTGSGYTSITVNGTALTPPVTPSAAATACSVSSTSGNTIVWTLR